MTELIANRFEILDALGEGAMGVVWLAKDLSTGKQVALKRITGEISEVAQLRFKQEFRMMTQLRHPNCCEVYEYGQLPDGAPFFTMEVVPGKGLDEMLPIDQATIMKLLPQLLAALDHVHALDFVHRDLKSANVRVTPEGVVKLMDFGLMEYSGASDKPISGTLGYLAPEIVKRGSIDQRTDLYAVGVLIFEMAANRLPFDRTTRVEILRAHVSEPPPPLSHVVGGIDPLLERVVSKLLAKEPLDRYQSAGEAMIALGFEGVAAQRKLLAPPLIGRDYESMQLFDGLGNLMCGEPVPTIVIHGPPGIGKSRLLKEFRSAIQLEDGLPFAAGAGRGESSTPYAPFRDVLRALVPAFQEHVPSLLKAHAPVLASLLPELGGEAVPAMDDPAKEKVRLQGVITTLLTALAARKPYVMLLEDWHLADPLSVELLDYLQRNLQGLPVLRILAMRSLPDDKPDWLGEAVKLLLPKLGDVAMSRMVSTILGTEAVPAAFLATVSGLADGNPFYVERLLEQLVAQGSLVADQTGWDLSVVLDPASLPRDLQGLLMRKLSSLPEDAITVARICAVLGRSFDLALLKNLTGFGDERLFDALGALQREQILAHEVETFGWAQDLFQEVVYESFTPEHRTNMHARVASALERRIVGGKLREAPFEIVKAIADHAILGCRPERIVQYALEAGRRSAGLFATREAEHYLGQALTLLNSDDSPRWQKPRLLALRLLGDTRLLTGQIAGAKACYHQAIPLAQQVGATMYLSRMFTALADCYTSEDNLAEALNCCERALEISLNAGDQASAARGYLTSCALRLMQGDLVGAIQQAQESLRLGRAVEDAGTTAEALAFLGHLYVAAMPERATLGVAHLEEAVVLLTDLNNKVGLQNALNMLGAAHYKRGDFAPAWTAFTTNREICFELGLKEEQAYALLNQAITAYELGNLGAGVKAAEDADALGVDQGVVHALSLAFRSAGKGYMGRLTEATKLMVEAVGLFKSSPNKLLEARVMEHRVAFLLHMGRLDEAQAEGERLMTLLKETGNSDPEGHVLAMLGEVKARRADYDGAHADLEAALAIARAGEAKGLEVQGLKAQAYIALRREDFATATQLAREALIVAHRIGVRYQTAELMGILGESCIATGDVAAGGYFKSMTEAAEEMGAKLLEALGLFGQAAAKPYDEEAKKHASKAQNLVHAMVVGLEPDHVEAFWGLLERQRVMKGNYIDFSFRKEKKSEKPPQAILPGGMPFGPGNW